MSNVPHRDLFSPIEKPKRGPNKRRPLKWTVPKKMGWKDVHGSWAVANGIVKIDKE
jgi:hypothetical protein